ncbi:hypothetical protein SAMN02799630_03554 [Paenibacillus sp. UNCCL117]|uniref:hypothetical protein n=1 Tax=unclassified Paenibacillus TaxID=185978 RepID=UPI000880D4D1|nr:MULTISPECIES: hypothetical protein [unclassified Paenibacillus]SDD39564.1 hypothetical protein SAMN04488602_10865 [Paenibacillus sp. cl123]SFW48335.1 hypothetical protein SAMN02799630_03554 [Paenibacillus sp. UNCCL117]
MKSLGAILVQSGGHVYREMTKVFMFSAVSSLVLAPLLLFLPAGLALVLLPLLYAPLVAGVFHAMHRMLEGERVKLKDMLAGAVRYFIPSVLFGLLCSLFLIILVSTWWYYGRSNGMWGWALAIFQTYFVLMVFVSQLYTLPLIVQKQESFFRAVGRSVKMTVLRPGYSIGAAFQLVCVTIVLAATVVGFAVLYAGIAAIYANMVTRNVLADEEEEAAPADGRQAWGGTMG